MKNNLPLEDYEKKLAEANSTLCESDFRKLIRRIMITGAVAFSLTCIMIIVTLLLLISGSSIVIISWVYAVLFIFWVVESLVRLAVFYIKWGKK